MPDLMLLFLLPLISSLILFSLAPVHARMLKIIAFAMSLVPLALLIIRHAQWIGSSIEYPWFPSIPIEFYLRVDSLSLIFIYLTAIVVPISILDVRHQNLEMPYVFFGLILLLESLLIGFFSARDLALFVIFFEAMLIPLYFIINLWGGSQRQTAAMEFLIYMIAGSVLMVAAVFFLYFAPGSGTFNLDKLSQIASNVPHSLWIGAIFALAFAVKTPLFPFHAWLPDAYYQAPTAGTILLSALLSKAGIYGFLRIGLELFPSLLKEWSPLFLGLAIAGVFYGGLAAWMQNDFKRLIAYSSFSHVNFVLVGVFVWSQMSHEGAILQALNHGLTITALFLVAGWLEERVGTTKIKPYSGLAKFLPQLCWLTLFFVLSSVALPGTNNFIGELMIFFGLFGQNPWLMAFLGLTVVLSVMYMLRWMQKMYFDEPTFFQESWIDIKGKELAIALPLVILILWIGIYPSPVLNLIQSKSENINTIASSEEP
jgi:NADH-quinone oxidoreductase subunit M